MYCGCGSHSRAHNRVVVYDCMQRAMLFGDYFCSYKGAYPCRPLICVLYAVLQAYDQHLNMILGEVEETVTTVEIDDETYEEIIKVSCRAHVTCTS
jgi:hypothetical protein